MKTKSVAIVWLAVMSLLSCRSAKNSCTTLQLDNDQVMTVQLNSSVSMYAFQFKEGPFKDFMAQLIHLHEPEVNTDFNLVHPKKMTTCIADGKDKWLFREVRDEKTGTVTLQANVRLTCDGKKYCFEINYTGPMQQLEPVTPH